MTNDMISIMKTYSRPLFFRSEILVKSIHNEFTSLRETLQVSLDVNVFLNDSGFSIVIEHYFNPFWFELLLSDHVLCTTIWYMHINW